MDKAQAGRTCIYKWIKESGHRLYWHNDLDKGLAYETWRRGAFIFRVTLKIRPTRENRVLRITSGTYPHLKEELRHA